MTEESGPNTSRARPWSLQQGPEVKESVSRMQSKPISGDITHLNTLPLLTDILWMLHHFWEESATLSVSICLCKLKTKAFHVETWCFYWSQYWNVFPFQMFQADFQDGQEHPVPLLEFWQGRDWPKKMALSKGYWQLLCLLSILKDRLESNSSVCAIYIFPAFPIWAVTTVQEQI